MEVEAAVRLWQRSEERHGLLYTGFLSDGYSKAHKAVSDLNIYTEPIVKGSDQPQQAEEAWWTWTWKTNKGKINQISTLLPSCHNSQHREPR